MRPLHRGLLLSTPSVGGTASFLGRRCRPPPDHACGGCRWEDVLGTSGDSLPDTCIRGLQQGRACDHKQGLFAEVPTTVILCWIPQRQTGQQKPAGRDSWASRPKGHSPGLQCPAPLLAGLAHRPVSRHGSRRLQRALGDYTDPQSHKPRAQPAGRCPQTINTHTQRNQEGQSSHRANHQVKFPVGRTPRYPPDSAGSSEKLTGVDAGTGPVLSCLGARW